MTTLYRFHYTMHSKYSILLVFNIISVLKGYFIFMMASSYLALYLLNYTELHPLTTLCSFQLLGIMYGAGSSCFMSEDGSVFR